MKRIIRRFRVDDTFITAITSSFAMLLWFNIDWCMATTFRAMSDPLLWVNTTAATILLSLPYIFTRRTWVHITALLIAYGLCEANLMYCRTYLTAIPPESYFLAGNLTDFTASLIDSLRAFDIIGLIIPVVAAVVMHRQPRPARAFALPLLILSVLLIISAIVINLRGGFYNAYDKLVQSCYYSTCGVPTYTIAGHIAYSLMDSRRRDTIDAKPEIDRWISTHESIVAAPVLPDSVEARKNLVLIICESLESWPLEATVNGKEITPYLNNILRDSTTFYAPNILTQVASGRSIDCQLLIHSGLMPMNGSVYSMKYPSVTYPSLNKALNERYGSLSYIFTCDKPITWNQQAISRAFGYDVLIDRSAWVMDEMIGNPAKLSDGSFFRQSVKKLGEGTIWPEGEPRMLTFVTYSGHNPFQLPQDMHDPDFDISDMDLPRRLADYITMAHYTDSQLHTIIDYLRSRSDFDETLVVIVGDHEGLAGDRRDFIDSTDEAARLVSPRQYTPFIVLNSPISGRTDSVAGQIDIYPTLLAMLGLSDYEWYGQGQSLLDPSRGAYAISMMTGEEVGDSTTLAPGLLPLLRAARRTSDAIIRSDYFSNKQH